MGRRPEQREDAVRRIERRGGNSRGQQGGVDRQQVAGIRALDVDLRLEDQEIVAVVDLGVGIGNRYRRAAGYDVGLIVVAPMRRIVGARSMSGRSLKKYSAGSETLLIQLAGSLMRGNSSAGDPLFGPA